MNNSLGHTSPPASRKRSSVNSLTTKSSPGVIPSNNNLKESSDDSFVTPRSVYKSSGPNSSSTRLKPYELRQLAEDIEDFCGIQGIIDNSKSKSFLSSLLDKRPQIYGERKAARREQVRKIVWRWQTLHKEGTYVQLVLNLYQVQSFVNKKRAVILLVSLPSIVPPTYSPFH